MAAIDAEYLRATLFDLIRIPSVNPLLTEQGTGETAIADYLCESMKSLSLSVERLEEQPGRVTVLGWRPGSGNGRSLMLNAHTDTVGTSGMAHAFDPVLRDGRVYGRGAQDMKGSLAACMAAIKALNDAGEKTQGDILIAAVADEEYSSLGTSEVIEHLRKRGYLLDGAIVTEPTGLEIALAHRGFMWIEIKTYGRAAHGSRWWEGVDANRMMGRVLVELDKLAVELTSRPSHRLVGPGSLHTPELQGGREMSIYADECQLQIERRTAPGENRGQVEGEIQSILERLTAEVPGFDGRVHTWFERQPFEAWHESPLVDVVRDQIANILSSPGLESGVPFWTDAALLAEAGVDVLLIGPHGNGLHTSDEWVDLDSCSRLAEILARSAIDYCGK